MLEISLVDLYPSSTMAYKLNTERAGIFRITHIRNVPWILQNGLHCRNSDIRDPGFVRIGIPELIEKRTKKIVPVQPGGMLSRLHSILLHAIFGDDVQHTYRTECSTAA